MENDFNETIWKILDIYFRDNPQGLIRHHIDSYNDFVENGISQIFRETNPLKIDLDYNSKENRFQSSAKLFFGGNDGSRVFFGKPIIYDQNENIHYMFPNEARLRNMTYAMPVYCDIETIIEREVNMADETSTTRVDKNGVKIDIGEEGLTPIQQKELVENITKTLITLSDKKTTIQRFKLRPIRKLICLLPIMTQSRSCILSGMAREARYSVGECRSDLGGYFIIEGKEKTVVCQEKFGDNMLYVQKLPDDHVYKYSANIRSVSENVSKPVRTLAVHLMSPTSALTQLNIVVTIPNVRKPIPLFIVFRALGVVSDGDIVSMCSLKRATETSTNMVQWLMPSIHEAGGIQSQSDALEFMRVFIKGKTLNRVLHILADYFLPHVGEINFIDKAYHLGYMVNKMWKIHEGEEATDRDNFKYKRIELVGSLLKDLMREYLIIYMNKARVFFETKFEFNKDIFGDISNLVEQSHEEVFANNILNDGIKKAFKGNWGATPNTKRIGVVQDLNRLSFYGYISHLRKTNLPLDASTKLVGPRVLHSSQWGILDPIDTPDGGNIGCHKYLTMLSYITRSHSREPLIAWIKSNTTLYELASLPPDVIGLMTKVMVNGYWVGSIEDPITFTNLLRSHRRQGLIPISTSIVYEFSTNTVVLYTDGGRICRPIFYYDKNGNKSITNRSEWKKIKNDDDVTWTQLISGFHSRRSSIADTYDPMAQTIYKWSDMYDIADIQMDNNKSIFDYMDTNEAEGAFIRIANTADESTASYTHQEIHESALYGIMCNMVNYIEHNPVTRNSFSCGQAKQAVSMYHTNFNMRMDKTAVVLNYGQTPIVKSRYLRYINNEENPNGENVIVAIMCYTGYNVEDAILVNKGSLDRGIFRTTYYSTYEAHEEKETQGDKTYTKGFSNIETLIESGQIVGTKPTYDYSQLGKNGLVHENTDITEKTVLIGTVSYSGQDIRKDVSKTPKKGQVGIVDKSFMTDGEEGQRIAKVRVREERIPAMGDKFASRAGQKGTIGMVVPEADMPFNAHGIRPDLIVNPHAMPSRMTIGQIVECLTGKGSAMTGNFADCTAFSNLRKGAVGYYGELLTNVGYHSSGCEIMYNGFTGEQIIADIFVGPTYYMRLKHMVKDKINYRARGPNTNLTRQPVSGRANDGGLRIGEMERDGLISHGISSFLKDSMMERGDKYEMAVCNTTGMAAVYNPSRHLLYSLGADGPVKFVNTIGGDGNQTQQIHQITKYGRSFSIVQIPYSLKLLIQEMQAMNIRISLITEDNIDQITNMAGSKNIELLLKSKTQKGESILKKIVDKTRPKTTKTNYNIKEKEKYQSTPEFSPPTTPEEPPPGYVPSSPEGPPPGYVPSTPEGPPPGYVPSTPEGPPPGYPSATWDKTKQMGGRVLEENMIVHYRGDFNPRREWKIQHVGNEVDNKRFYTIDTINDLDLHTEDTIKVVRADEIYLPTENMVYSMPHDEGLAASYPTTLPSNGNGVDHGEKIHFAPVIKIITDGNDNSVESKKNNENSLPIEEDKSKLDFNKPLLMVNKTNKE